MNTADPTGETTVAETVSSATRNTRTRKGIPHLFRPVFIVGNERSGTTLMATLLDRHSRIAATPETHVFYPCNEFIWKQHYANPESLVRAILDTERARDLGLTVTDVHCHSISGTKAYEDAVEAILKAYAERCGKPRVAEKSPFHVFHVRRILKAYPHARILCMVRDGRDAVLSLIKARWAHNDTRLHATRWRQIARITLALERAYPERFMRVHFEQLLQNPEEELERVTEFIGEVFEPSMLVEAASAKTVPAWELEWKGKALEQLDPSRVFAWRDAVNADERRLLNLAMGDALTALGYADTNCNDCPTGAWIKHHTLNWVYRTAYASPLHMPLRAVKRVLGR
ncbi:MAG: sulfotransferase [Candidatus Hydrogenedentota bacterium]